MNLQTNKLTETNSSYANKTSFQSALLEGFKSGIPIAIGYIPIALTFGLLAKAAGVPSYASIMMSFFVFAGASQFVAVNLLTIGTPFWLITLTTFVINSRQFLMSASLSQKIEKSTSKLFLSIISYGITDETFTISSLRPEPRLNPFYILALNLTAFASWNIGTWGGLFLASALPKSIQASMGIALYVMFIGLLVPSVRKSLPLAAIALASAILNSILHRLDLFGGLSMGLNIVISTLLVSAGGALLFAKKEDRKKGES